MAGQWHDLREEVGLSREVNREPILPPWPAPSPSQPERTRRCDSTMPGQCHPRDYDHMWSSDPPLFSSDDLPAGLENYSSHRSKRQYQGPWWDGRSGREGDHSNDPIQQKREFKRNIDSGVWMGSDDTEMTEDGDLDTEVTSRSGTPSPGLSIGTPNESQQPTAQLSRGFVCPVDSQEPEDVAQRKAAWIIQQRVDEGRESFDLSNLALGHILDTTLKPLHYLTRQEQGDLSPRQEAYGPFLPAIQLFLANNNLGELPCDIYRLQNLYHLSVRQNNLSSISPLIFQLTNLNTLNLSANKLRYLPWELALHSKRSKDFMIRIHPNPLLIPISHIPDLSYKDVWESMSNRLVYLKVAASHVAYFEIDGSPCRKSLPAPSLTKNYTPSAPTGRFPQVQPWSNNPPRTPSLLELALRAYSGQIFSHYSYLLTPLNKYVSQWLPNQAPLFMLPLLKKAMDAKRCGETICYVCKKVYVIPRVEWIEWWQTMNTDQPEPYIRRGCSWACAKGHDRSPVAEEWNNCGWKEGAD